MKKLFILLCYFIFTAGIKVQLSTPAGSTTTPLTTTFGDALIAERIETFNIIFQYNIPTDLITSATSGTGSISAIAPFAVLTSSTNGTGTSQIEGKRKLRCLPSHEAYAHFTAIFSAGVANTTQYMGIMDDNDGWAIGYNGTTFSIFWKRNGSNVAGYPIAQSNFNLDQLNGTGASKFNIDPTKNNTYRISFGWLGEAPIIFEILRDDGTWFPFHMIKYQNVSPTSSINSSVLPMRAYISASGAASNVTLKSASMCCGTIGKNYGQSRTFQYYPGDVTTSGGAGNNKYIFTLKNSTTFPIGGVISNKVDVKLNYLAASNKSATWTVFRLIKNATLSGTSYSNIDSTNSCIQYDTSGNYVSGGSEIFVLPLSQQSQELVFFAPNDIEIFLYPGETITVLSDVSGNSIINVSLLWKELL